MIRTPALDARGEHFGYPAPIAPGGDADRKSARYLGEHCVVGQLDHERLGQDALDLAYLIGLENAPSMLRVAPPRPRNVMQVLAGRVCDFLCDLTKGERQECTRHGG